MYSETFELLANELDSQHLEGGVGNMDDVGPIAAEPVVALWRSAGRADRIRKARERLKRGPGPDEKLLMRALSSPGDERLEEQLFSLRTRLAGSVGDKGKFPKLSRLDFDAIQLAFTRQPNNSVAETLLSRYYKPGSPEWKAFFSIRYGQRQPNMEGGGDYEVARNPIPSGPAVQRAPQGKGKQRNYTLAQVLSDTYVREKYELTMKVIDSAQLLAITRPADAALLLQTHMREAKPDLDIKVTAAAYDTGPANMERILDKMAAKFPMPNDIVCDIVGGKAFLNCPPGPDVPWQIMGPLNRIPAMVNVYKLVMHGGCYETIHLFAFETQVLKIEVIYDGQVVSPTVKGHADVDGTGQLVPDHSHELDPVVAARFKRLARNVLPVRSRGGESHRIATTLRVDNRAVLVNEHVHRSVEELYVDGKKLVASTVVGRDMWAFRHDGDYEPWVFSEPKRNMRVAVMYHDGEGVRLSKSFKINRVDRETIISTRCDGVVPGMSGGALVNVSDMTLVGVHCSENIYSLLATRVSTTMRDDVAELFFTYDQDESKARDDGAELMASFKVRGLAQQFAAAAASVSPLYVGDDHVGCAVQVSSGVLATTCDAPGLALGDGKEVGFGEFRRGLASAVVADGSAPPVPISRRAQAQEHVVVLGCDDRGIYVSDRGIVQQPSKAGSTFMVAGLGEPIYPLKGGLVVAVQDCVAIGILSSHRLKETGSIAVCVAVPKFEDAEPESCADGLQRVFPFLTVSAWPSGLADQVFTHPSCVPGEASASNMGLAKLGDVRMKLALYETLQNAGEPIVTWDRYVQTLQCNASLARVAESLDLPKLIRKQSGLNFVAGCKAHSDMLEALVEAVCIVEEREVVSEFLSVIGVVPYEEDLEGPDKNYAKVMSTVGEVSLPRQDGSLVSPIL